MPKSTMPRRMMLTPSCNHLDRIAGALGWSLTAARKLLTIPFLGCCPLPCPLILRWDPSSQSLSDSSESCGSRDRTLPTSRSLCNRFRFRTLSLFPLAISPRPGVRLRIGDVLKIDLLAVVTDAFPKSSRLSVSGVSTGISDVSVMAGLDSAPENSE